jgi:hypothetical protein
MNIILSIIVAFCLVQQAIAASGNVERYTLQFGTAQQDERNGVCVNQNNDNAYIVGFNNNAEMSLTVISFTGINILNRVIVDSFTELGMNCVIDANEDLVVAGTTTGPSFEGTTNAVNNGGFRTALIVKFNGNTLGTTWVSFVNNEVPNEITATGIATDASGNYYISGTTQGKFTGGAAFGASQTTAAWYGKLDSSGALIYKFIVPHTHNTASNCAAYDMTNDFLYVVGTAQAKLYDGDGFTAADIGNSHTRGVVTKITGATGAIVEGRTLTAGNSDDLLGCAVDPSGDVYAVGRSRISGVRNIVATKVQPASSWNVVYNRLLTANHLDDRGNAIAVDAAGLAYFVGQTREGSIEGFNLLPGGVGNDKTSMFYIKLNADGTTNFATGYSSGSAVHDAANGVGLDSYENMIAGGVAGDIIGTGPAAGGNDNYVFSYGDPMPTGAPTKAPTAVPTMAPTCQVIEIESAHPYPRDDFQTWTIDVPSWGGCYKATMDPQSWTPEKYDFVRLFSVTGGTETQLPTADRLYKNRLPDYGTQNIYGDQVKVDWYSDYVNPAYLRRYPWTDKFKQNYGFKMYFTCCDDR